MFFELRISKNLVFCLRKVLDIFNTDKKYKKVLRRYGYWIRIPYLEINRLSSLVLSRVLSLFYFLWLNLSYWNLQAFVFYSTPLQHKIICSSTFTPLPPLSLPPLFQPSFPSTNYFWVLTFCLVPIPRIIISILTYFLIPLI